MSGPGGHRRRGDQRGHRVGLGARPAAPAPSPPVDRDRGAPAAEVAARTLSLQLRVVTAFRSLQEAVKLLRRCHLSGLVPPRVSAPILRDPDLSRMDSLAPAQPVAELLVDAEGKEASVDDEVGRAHSEREAYQDDVRKILLALGLGDHARPVSCHQIVEEEILPAIRRAVNGAPG